MTRITRGWMALVCVVLVAGAGCSGGNESESVLNPAAPSPVSGPAPAPAPSRAISTDILYFRVRVLAT